MSAATSESTLHLLKLEIENFMGVQALTVDAAGRHVVITGKNGAGKTSAIDALWAAMGGKPSKEMPEPVRKGADKATVTLDLGEYVVTRYWSAKSSRLVVAAADGSKIREPQALLNGLLGKLSLDPAAFLELRSKDQVDQIMEVCGVEAPVDKVLEIVGGEADGPRETHYPRPGESADGYLMRLSGDETGLYYVRRREANRAVDQKRKALDEQRAIVEALGGPIDPAAKDASASDLLSRIEHLQQQADQRRALRETAVAAQQEHAKGEELLRGLQTEHERTVEKIVWMKEQLVELRRSRDAAAARIAKGETIVQDLAAEAVAAAAAFDAHHDPTTQILALRQQVTQLESSNAQRAKRLHANEQHDRITLEVEAAAAEHARLDQVLERLRFLRAHLLDGVDLGVAGLEVGDGELRLRGVPFRQASQAEQIRVAVAVATKQKPRLRLLRLDDAEHLDAESRALVLQLAECEGFQCLMTCVNDSELKVEIVEHE